MKKYMWIPESSKVNNLVGFRNIRYNPFYFIIMTLFGCVQFRIRPKDLNPWMLVNVLF
jgi:hypothetical protein